MGAVHGLRDSHRRTLIRAYPQCSIMSLQYDDAVEDFLGSFPEQILRRGRAYFDDGAVLQLYSVSNNSHRALVRGSHDYDVNLDYDPRTATWDCDCTCPVGPDCKHAVAAMLALREKLSGKRVGRGSNRKGAAGIFHPRPADSPLYSALRKALKRPLTPGEANYVVQVQGLWASLTTQPLYEHHLRLFSRGLDVSWGELHLWPKHPADDHELWLYIVNEVRRRGGEFPDFMLHVSDTSPIEPGLKAWQREKEIQRWRETLRRVPYTTPPVHEPVDLRLLVHQGRLVLQSRNVSEDTFHDLAPRQFSKLAEGIRNGSDRIVPEAMPLWLCFINCYDGFGPVALKVDDPASGAEAGLVFRIPGIADRVVTRSGQPLPRPSESLKYALEEPEPSEENYVLRLVRQNGRPAPSLDAVIPGEPVFYLTSEGLFEGPPPHAFDPANPLAIPAAALESRSGVKFLQSLNLPLPQRIAERIRQVPVQIILSCHVQSPPQGTDSVALQLTCKQQGNPDAVCSPYGWMVPGAEGGSAEGAVPDEVSEDGLIYLKDDSVNSRFPRLLDPLKPKWEGYRNAWRVPVNKAFPERFVAFLQSLPAEVQVELDPQLSTIRDAPLAGSVQLNIEEAGVDWFDLKVTLNVSDLDLTPEELKLLLNARGRFVRLGTKGWRRLQFSISDEENDRLAELGLDAGDFSAEPQRFHALQLANPAARKLLPAEQAAKIERRASEIQTRVCPQVPAAITAELRPYQVAGFHFLSYLSANRFGGVLADDMGLGKTLQAITWLCWLRNSRATSASSCLPALVVCPKSVMENWLNEAAHFWPGTRVLLWHGEAADALIHAREQADLIVINYAQLRSLSPQITEHHWLAAILDEAQYIKNPGSQTAQAARALNTDHRLALTGTPIENRLLDLWSIFSFAMPGALGNRSHFMRTFNQQEDPLAQKRLAARVRPFLLRRTKSQVAQDLPDKVEEDIVCEMEGPQHDLYQAEFKSARQRLLGITSRQELNEQRFNFLTSLLRLRQICCHPGLVDPELAHAQSAKVSALMDILEPIIEEGDKVLVFSQFVTMLEILRKAVADRKWTHYYIAGDTENRGKLVQSFQNRQGPAVFLISLKAGGFGLNLTAASYVVLFDPWWNPAVETQAIDRTHRIGQPSKVIAYRLLIKDSIEQKIRHLQRSKAALAEDVMGEERFGRALTLEDLQFLFKE